MEKKSFIIYKDWDNAIRKAPENIQLELYHALMDFASTGEKPKDLSWEGELLISAIENSVGSMIARYKACAENGKLGGRPRKASCKENLENTSFDEKNKFNAVESSISEKELVENMADKNALSSKDIEKSNVSEECKKPESKKMESKKTSSVDKNNKNLETSENVKNSLNSKKTTKSKKEKNEKLEDVEIDVVKAERIKKDSKYTSKTNNGNLKKDEIKADIYTHEKKLQSVSNGNCHTKQAEKKCSESNPLHKNQKKPNHNLNDNVNDNDNDNVNVDDDVDDNVDDDVNVDCLEEQRVSKKDSKLKNINNNQLGTLHSENHNNQLETLPSENHNNQLGSLHSENNNNQLGNLPSENHPSENLIDKDVKILQSLCEKMKIDCVVDTKKYDTSKLIQKVKESRYLKSFRSLFELISKYDEIMQDKYKDFAVSSLSSQNKEANKHDYSQEELSALFVNIEDVEI